MVGRPCPSTSEVTWARPRREEWPYPGSRGRHTSWRQRSAQGSAAPKSRQRHIAKFASTRKHAAHRTAKQSKAVYHNEGGRQPHHPPQARAPAQHPTPSVGGRPTTRALHPRTATAAHKRGARAQESQAGPGGSDSAPPMGGRPCPSASEVTRTRPPREERPCPGSRGRRASWRQRSAQRGGSIAHNAAQQAKAGRGTQCNSPAHNSTQQHTTTEEQSKVVYHNNSGGQPHHPPRTPTPAKHPTPRVGAKPTTQALHPHPATAAHKLGTHREHHQEPKTPHPNANTAPTTHATTKATLTHNIEGMLP